MSSPARTLKRKQAGTQGEQARRFHAHFADHDGHKLLEMATHMEPGYPKQHVQDLARRLPKGATIGETWTPAQLRRVCRDIDDGLARMAEWAARSLS